MDRNKEALKADNSTQLVMARLTYAYTTTSKFTCSTALATLLTIASLLATWMAGAGGGGAAGGGGERVLGA